MTTLRAALAALLFTVAVFATGCVDDACNGECEAGFHCDEALIACVPDGSDGGGSACTSDEQCNAARPHCEPDLGRCVACVTGDHCSSGRCDPLDFTCLPPGCSRNEECETQPGTPFCGSSGACVECRFSGDCPALNGQRRTCDLTAHRCVANPCRDDGDCSTDANGRVCDETSGRCIQCERDDQCATGRCRVDTNACVVCLVDGDCDATLGETCDVARNTCVVTNCVNDSQCAGASRCNASGDCVGCIGAGDCEFGGTCTDGSCAHEASCAADSDCVWPAVCASGTCAACRTNDDCGTGRTCTNGACIEPATCTDTAQCSANRVCQAGTCTAAACTADAFEPNENAASASQVGPGRITARLCPNEVDLYALRLQEGAGIEATLTWDPSLGTPELALILGSSGQTTTIAGTPDGAGRMRVLLEAASTGVDAALLRVSGASGTIPYTLETRISATGLCADDGREEDDLIGQAKPAGGGVFDGVLCPTIVGQHAHSEEDWFVVDVPEDYRPSATLQLDAGVPSLNVALELHAVRDGVIERDAWGNTTATASHAAGPGGEKFWIVVKNQTAEKHDYQLTIDLRPKPPTNDTCDEPPLLAPNTTQPGHTRGAADDGAASCGGAGGDTFWTLELATASRVTLSLAADFDGVVSLQTACEGAELGCATGPALTDTLSFDGLPAGSYIVRIDAAAGREGNYTIRADVSATETAPVGTDCESAVPLVFASDRATAHGQLALATDAVTSTCGGTGNDATWLLELAEPRRVKANLQAFAGASISLVAEGACAEMTDAACVAATATGTARPTAALDVYAVPAGRWILVVDGGSVREGAFDLTVDLGEALFPPENDACDGALGLVETQSGDLRGARGDFRPQCTPASHAGGDAVYRLTVVGEDEVTLELNASFDAAIAVTDGPCGTGATLACADGPRAKVVLPALSTGEYYVWVDAFTNGTGTYTLTSTRAPAAPLPANDACADAELVTLGTEPVTVTGSTRRALDDLAPSACVPAGTSTPLDVDGPDVVYAVDVPAGRTLRAVLTPSAFDGAIYVLDGCGANSCIAGADGSFLAGGTESLAATNGGTDTVRWLVVVDAWRATATGTFELALTLE